MTKTRSAYRVRIISTEGPIALAISETTYETPELANEETWLQRLSR